MPVLLSAAAVAIALSAAEPLAINRIVINDSPGDQTDPHVSGDLVAYSNFAGTQEIRYYRFSTGVDTPITNLAGDGTRSIDQLAGVSGPYITFTRINSPNTESDVMLFDAELGSLEPVEINESSDSARSNSAIGGNSVAYVDHYSLFTPQPGTVMHFDLITGIVTQLSSSGLRDVNPQVSPDGNVVVWQRCETLLSCDVVQAVRQPDATFSEVDVANTAAEENDPDTNGEVVVYVKDAGNEADIHYRAVAGGEEFRLLLDGVDSNPHISGSLISFENRLTPQAPADILLFDLLTQRLFRVSDTFFNNEALNDVFVDPDGTVRMVWQSDDDADGFSTNIYGAVFSLPPAPVPLPGAAWLLAPGLLALARLRKAP
ncbi:MAG: hypothetical protein AB7Q97_26420 [Gammaproteobacteria bacterium]